MGHCIRRAEHKLSLLSHEFYETLELILGRKRGGVSMRGYTVASNKHLLQCLPSLKRRHSPVRAPCQQAQLLFIMS